MLPCLQDRAATSIPFCWATLARACEKIWMPTGQSDGGMSRGGLGPAALLEIEMRAGNRRAAGDHLAAEDIRLPLEPPREVAEDQPEEGAEQARSDRPSTISPTSASSPETGPRGARDPDSEAENDLRRQRQDSQAAQEEEAEEGQMPVCHVADLVAEDRRDLDRAQRVDQGVGQEDVAEPRQDAGDAGIDHHVPGVPDQEIGEAEADPPRHALEPPTQRAVRQAAESARPGG